MQVTPCRRRPIWAEQARVTNVPPVVQPEVRSDVAVQVNPHLCDKCGKEVRRGMFFHRKYCKG